MARPKKSDTARRTRQFTVRFTEEEARAIEDAAAGAQLRVAEWLNRAAGQAVGSRPTASEVAFTSGLAEAGDGQVVGVLVVDRERRPHLLTTWRGSGGRFYPCILRWDQTERRWMNTSDERTGSETARILMEELAIDPGHAEITHHYVFRLVRKAWNRLEEVLYDRIRK